MAEEQKKDELTEDQIIDLIADFYQDPDFEELKRLYLTKSFPEILAVDRREEIHSAFLAWLLDMNESHGLGDFPIKQFLKILVRRDRIQHKDGINRHKKSKASTKEKYVEIINEDFTITEMHVSRENITKDKDGRMDILINMKAIFPQKTERNIHIVIENKVYSDEHDNQTEKYFNHITSTYKNKKDICLFVYLTPLSKRDLDDLIKPECTCSEYIQTNYQDLLDYILEPAVRKDISMRNRFVIEEYINCLSLPAINIDNDEYTINLNTIMATDDNRKRLLNAFWEKNEPLLKAALKSLAETTEDADVSEELSNAIGALDERKDNTHYEFNKTGSGKIKTKGKADLVTAVVQEILENGVPYDIISTKYKDALKPLEKKEGVYENRETTFDIIIKKLGEKNMTCRQFNSKFCNPNKNALVLNEEDHSKWIVDKTKDIYKEVTVKDKTYYILKEWGLGNIDHFVFAFYGEIPFDETYKWEGLEKKDFKVIK